MIDYTRPATRRELLKIVELFQKNEVEFVLVGGYVLASHGCTGMTIGTDIMVDPSFDNSEKWILTLSELPDGLKKELTDEVNSFDGDCKNAIRITDKFENIDAFSLSAVDYQTLTKHIYNVQIRNINLPVLHLEELLLTKAGQEGNSFKSNPSVH